MVEGKGCLESRGGGGQEVGVVEVKGFGVVG